MPLFIYQIMDTSGRVRTGRIDKSSLEEAKTTVAGMDVTLLGIRPISLWDMDINELSLFGRRIRKTDAALFCRQISFLLSSGVRITDAFAMLLAAAKPGSFRDILAAMQGDLRKGESLSECMRIQASFPAMLAGMVRMGEMSGRLPQILSKMADHYEQEVRTEEELKSAMIYPALVSVMMIGVMIIAVTFVVPNYVQLFMAGGIDLPFPTRALIALSGFIRSNYRIMIGFVLAAAAGGRAFTRTRKGQYIADYIKLHLPIYRMVYVKRLNLRFAQSLSLMLDAGQPLVLSLSALKAVMDNQVISRTMDEIGLRLEEGAAFGKCLEESRYFEPMLCGMVMMGEETGGLDLVLDRCGAYFQRETDALILRINKIVDPALTIALGLILAFLMLAIMLPTFALTDIA